MAQRRLVMTCLISKLIPATNKSQHTTVFFRDPPARPAEGLVPMGTFLQYRRLWYYYVNLPYARSMDRACGRVAVYLHRRFDLQIYSSARELAAQKQ